MKTVLDDLVIKHGIKIFFHTFYQSLIVNEKRIEYIIVGNKDGIGIIRGKFFVDATGDGDVCRDANLERYIS